MAICLGALQRFDILALDILDQGNFQCLPVIDSVDVSEANSVKYAIDALKEQIRELRQETRDLHYQLEQRSGQVGFLQGKIESLQEEIKALMPAPKPEVEHKPWYRRMFSRN